MGHTNSTANYNLPQFVGTDKPSWLGDVNGAFLAIDTAIAAAKSQADSAAGGVAGLQTTVSGHTTQIGTLTDTVTAQGGTLNSVTALIGNGTPTTTDQTIIGAINEINAKVPTGEYVEVTGDGVKTYSAILDELYALVDHTKLKNTSQLILVQSATANAVYNMCANSSNAAISFGGVDQNGCWGVQVKSSGSVFNGFTFSNTTLTPYGSQAMGNGQKFRLVY